MSFQRRVAFIELHLFQGVYPLTSGYLQAAACQNEQIRNSFEFAMHSYCVKQPKLEDILLKIDADIFAVSCYVWNMGFIKSWLPKLISKSPQAQIILGGPQVLNNGSRYLISDFENLVVCNGEGELVFSNYLLQLCYDKPDFSIVKGLSYYDQGNIITTPQQERIRNLNEIPSPYLEGYLDPSLYTWAPIETNRGCPFNCTYCFWGAATNAKVYKKKLERTKSEITWLSKNRAIYIFIADANFGMLKQDIDIALHIAECKKAYGYPLTVYYSSSKNTPDRVIEITKIFGNSGLTISQPVSLQTMNENSLKSVKRSNIKTSTYISLQNELNDYGLSSFIEIIWPLPDETLVTFKKGIGDLCSLGVDSFLIYPLLLINNIELDDQREKFSLNIIDDPDPNSEAKIVVGTNSVTRSEYKEGTRFGYHVTSLHSFRGLRFLFQYLDQSGIVSYTNLLSSFTDFCKSHTDNPYVKYVNRIVEQSEQYKYSSVGGLAHLILHKNRLAFDLLVAEFVDHLNIKDDDFAGMLYELDILNRPYIYSNTPIQIEERLFSRVRISYTRKNYVTINIPSCYSKDVFKLLNLTTKRNTSDILLDICYLTNQLPYMNGKSLEANLIYCQDKIHNLSAILPVWSIHKTGFQ